MRRLGLAVLLTAACGRAPACPPGLAADQERAARVTALLRETQRGRSLPEAERICFAAPPAGVWREDGVFALSLAASDGENAARLGHLLLHASEKRLTASAGDCEAFVARAMQAESRARSLELDLARELSVAPQPADSATLEREYRARCSR